MKRESKTTRQIRKSLSKLSTAKLEDLAGLRISFKDGAPWAAVRSYHRSLRLAQELLDAKKSDGPTMRERLERLERQHESGS